MLKTSTLQVRLTLNSIGGATLMGRFWKELFGDRGERSGAKAERLKTRANAMALLRQKPIAEAGVSPALSAPAGQGECVLPAGQSQAVVGESHYQPALRAATGGRKAGSWDDHIVVKAQLIPEPKNKYDRNAVAVRVGGRTVGYLPAEVAVDYQPVLLGLLRRGLIGTCEGAIVGGGSKSYGIWLKVAEPDVISFFLEAPDHVQPVAGSSQVTVTGEESYQDILRSLNGPGESVRYLATLHPGVVAKGKYAGSATAEIRIENRPVGSLTGPMGARFQPLMDTAAESGKFVGCVAYMSSEGSKGLQVSLMMPSIRELEDICS